MFCSFQHEELSENLNIQWIFQEFYNTKYSHNSTIQINTYIS